MITIMAETIVQVSETNIDIEIAVGPNMAINSAVKPPAPIAIPSIQQSDRDITHPRS